MAFFFFVHALAIEYSNRENKAILNPISNLMILWEFAFMLTPILIIYVINLCN